jgi:hypothetical protein
MARRRTALTLDADKIVGTAEQLRLRIAARFPDSGLEKVCAGLVETARVTGQRARGLGQPYYGLRMGVTGIVILTLGAQIFVAWLIDWGTVIRQADPVGITQGLEAVVNLLLLAFAAIWFLITVETRLKRQRALRWLHELRSIAHVIDMHQLTKDPSVELGAASVTTASVKRDLKDFELSRYLDYCSEMLALVAKLAALFAADNEDAEVISAINEVESLTADLCRNIWQKIILIGNLADRAP